MKKRVYVLAAVLSLGLGLSGCSGGSGAAKEAAETTAAGEAKGPKGAREVDESGDSQEKADKSGETQLPEESQLAVTQGNPGGFLFEANGVVMGMNEEVSPILSGLGEYNNYAETPSCAFQGLDKIYSYNGFDLYTYPKGDVDYVNSIYFIDESVSTPEGIHLGSTQEEMLSAYGEDYAEEFGVYTYTKEKSTLSFLVTDGVIESIEYVAITE